MYFYACAILISMCLFYMELTGRGDLMALNSPLVIKAKIDQSFSALYYLIVFSIFVTLRPSPSTSTLPIPNSISFPFVSPLFILLSHTLFCRLFLAHKRPISFHTTILSSHPLTQSVNVQLYSLIERSLFTAVERLTRGFTFYCYVYLLYFLAQNGGSSGIRLCRLVVTVLSPLPTSSYHKARYALCLNTSVLVVTLSCVV